VAHLLDEVVEDGGRLLIGPYTEERDETRTEHSLEKHLTDGGQPITGRLERPHPRDDRVVRRLLYLDRGV
jgi:hypothetical protein